MRIASSHRFRLACFVPLFLAACSSDSGTEPDPTPTVAVASVEVTTPSTSLIAGQTVQLSAIAKDASGKPLSGRTFAWSSSKDNVATVSTSGLVTGVAPGEVTIRATSENRSGEIVLSVMPIPVASISISPDTATVHIGSTMQLNATAKDASGQLLTGRTVTWSSSDAAVASVSSSGLVSAKAAGQVTVTATSEGKSGTAEVEVLPVPIASITVFPDSLNLEVGQTRQLTVTLKDASANVLTGRAVSWNTSNQSVARVAPDGTVTAMAEGQVTITATSEGKNGNATVVIIPAQPGSLKLSFSGMPDSSNARTFQIKSFDNLTQSRTVTQDRPLVISGLAPGLYTVQALDGYAVVDGTRFTYRAASNPRAVNVPSGGEIAAHFVYTLASGAVALQVSGLPSGVKHGCTAYFAGGWSSFYGTSSIGPTAPTPEGRVEVRCQEVWAGGAIYDPNPGTQAVVVPISTTPVTAKVAYSIRE